jgi:L-aspartate oxidase
MKKTDFLVIGSGVGGLITSIHFAQENPDKQVVIVTKNDLIESNSKYAQGGIAIVTDAMHDSFEKHIEDTMRAGAGLNDREVVEFVIKEGPELLQELLTMGADFDKNIAGGFDLGREGGHTAYRVLHHKDITGFEIVRTLVKMLKQLPNIKVFEHHFAIDLITDHHLGQELPRDEIRCYGAYVRDKKSGEVKKMTASVTVLATGGAGQVYRHTTNPIVATGDGIGMAYRAKAFVKHMQFVQFHPTALYGAQTDTSFLISEAVRGFGAKLRTKNGERFMHKYDPREDLASRDIVARAIDNELKISGDDYVVLDCTHLDNEAFYKHFPNIYDKCKSVGIDLFKEPVPVVPTAHYFMGGVAVKQYGETNLKNLLAVGEVTCSGLHGANRLASNSLLEALVYGKRAASKAKQWTDQMENENVYDAIPEWNQQGLSFPDEMIVVNFLKKDLKNMMSDLVGIVRSDARLLLAEKKEEEIYKAMMELYNMSILTQQLGELRNLVNIAYLIIQQSKEQKENVGGFFNKDLN